MTKKEIAKRIKDCENELAKLRDELNQPEYSGKRWKPEHGDRYWAITADGQIITFNWYNTACDNDILSIGNVFPTKEAARFEIERRKVVAELSDYSEGNDAVWDGTQRHYQLFCNYGMNRVECDFNKSSKSGCLYFPSEEAARAAVEAVGEERVKKYYLGVEE